MATTANWTREETFKLISLWSEDVIQEQLEGCRRNSLVYRRIADDLREAGFARTLEQCRDKIKKLKGEYKKVRDKRETTGEGRYPEWEFFDALDNVLGPKHSTEPPTVVESFPQIGPDDETQDMSGEPAVHSPAPSHASSSSTQVNTEQDGETQPSESGTQPSGSGTQPSGSGTQPSGSGTQPSGSGSKSRKRKRGRNEATNELLEKMITMQKSSDQMMMSLEEKRMKMEERQIELDAQMRREERQFQLQMMQMLMQQNMAHSVPPPIPHHPMHSTFNFGSTADREFDPDETQDGLQDVYN